MLQTVVHFWIYTILPIIFVTHGLFTTQPKVSNSSIRRVTWSLAFLLPPDQSCRRVWRSQGLSWGPETEFPEEICSPPCTCVPLQREKAELRALANFNWIGISYYMLTCKVSTRLSVNTLTRSQDLLSNFSNVGHVYKRNLEVLLLDPVLDSVQQVQQLDIKT